MLVVLEGEFLDIAAALREDGDEPILFKALDRFPHGSARAAVVD
jgi:hypothetical protein